MERILPWLAILVAATVAVLAVIELDNRSDEDDQLAIPTFMQPTPSTPATEAPAREEETPRPATPADTAADETAAATPKRTATPPRTPTPAPPITPGPTDASRGPTPRTGGGALLPGLLIASLALVVRAGMHRRAGSY